MCAGLCAVILLEKVMTKNADDLGCLGILIGQLFLKLLLTVICLVTFLLAIIFEHNSHIRERLSMFRERKKGLGLVNI